MMLLQMPATAPGDGNNALVIFSCVIFMAVLFAYTFRPATAAHGAEKTRLAYLYERKEQTFENLRDLNFEHKAGKLSEADFASMRDAMEAEAAGILAEIDTLEKAGGVRGEEKA